jgi:hypothetical protein
MNDKMAVMNRWMEEALSEGNGAAKEHLHAMARIIGGQVARIAEPVQVPEVLSSTIEELGKGVTAGMLMQHGQAGMLAVKLFSIKG